MTACISMTMIMVIKISVVLINNRISSMRMISNLPASTIIVVVINVASMIIRISRSTASMMIVSIDIIV